MKNTALIPGITSVLMVKTGQNIGCTQCGQRAVQVIVYRDETTLEVVEAQCPIHAEVGQ